MSTHDAETKAYQDKVNAELQQVMTRIEEFEARDKSRMAKAEIDSLQNLKMAKQQIDKKCREMRAADAATINQIKADIDTGISRLKSGVDQVAKKLKREPHAKAS
jgi:uncharacterized protein YicC (UPF0701 family)